MKKIHFAFLGLTLLAGVVLFSAFSDQKVEDKEKRDLPTVYFRYIPSDNDEDEFGESDSWAYVGTTNPGAICGPQGTDACIVELPTSINGSIDPDNQTNLEMQQAFADLLESYGVSDFSYSAASDFVQAHVQTKKL